MSEVRYKYRVVLHVQMDVTASSPERAKFDAEYVMRQVLETSVREHPELLKACDLDADFGTIVETMQ